MNADEHLRIATKHARGRLILELEGELDLVSSALLQQAVAGASLNGSSLLVLDMRGVSFLDSTGLKAIFSARHAALEQGCEFAVTPGSVQVQRLLTLTRLGEHLQTIETPDAASA